jgi:tRNA A37 threonylcarbamoyladenosine synthetase subunit TsaC/SUA5/YrdC
MSTTLQLPGDEQPLNDPYEVRQRLEKLVDLIIDGAFGDLEPTTVVDLSEDVPRVVREGRGDVARLGAV